MSNFDCNISGLSDWTPLSRTPPSHGSSYEEQLREAFGEDYEAFRALDAPKKSKKPETKYATYYGHPSEFEDPAYTELYPEVQAEQEYKPLERAGVLRSAEYRPGDEYRGMSQIVTRKKTRWTKPPRWEASSYMELCDSYSTIGEHKRRKKLRREILNQPDIAPQRQVPPVPIIDLHKRELPYFQNLYADLSDSEDIEHLLVEIVKMYGREEDRQWASELPCIKTATSDDWDGGAYMRLLTIIWNLLEDCQRLGALREPEDQLIRYYQYPLQARALAQAYERMRHQLAEVVREKTELWKELVDVPKRREIAQPTTSDEFVKELEHQKEMNERLVSSFQEILEQEHRSNAELSQRLFESEARAVGLEEYTKEIAGSSTQINLLQDLRSGILSRVQSLTPNPAEIENAVEEWMNTAQQVLEHKKREINQILDNHKFLEQKRLELLIEVDKKEAEIATIQSTPKQPKKSLIPRIVRKSAGRARKFFSPSHRHQPSPDTPGTRRAPISPDYEDFPEQFEESFELEETPPSSIHSASISPLRDISSISISLPSPTEHIISPHQTTPPPRTPFVSKSRFGYTDPTVPFRQLNMPPGPLFDIPTPFRKTVVLTSPKREEPLVVNIDVDPKPLTVTERGESFICDIALNVQPGGQDLLPQLQASGSASPYQSDRIYGVSDSPVIEGRLVDRRKAAPHVVFSRRGRNLGLFTPKGVLNEGRLKIRRVPGRHPIPELPWSPTYLPEDARSPVSSLLSSPLQWSDRSVSWEKQYESDYTSSPSTSPIIKGPTYGYRSSDSSDLTSPVIRLPGFSYRSTDSDLSYSPVIRRQGSRFRSPESSSPFSSPLFASPPPGNQDQFNRRILLSEMQVPGTPGRTYVSDSMDSDEQGYLESPLDSSLLNESRFLG